MSTNRTTKKKPSNAPKSKRKTAPVKTKRKTTKAAASSDNGGKSSIRRPTPTAIVKLEDTKPVLVIKRSKPTKRKDPTDALGNFIGVLDVDKIDRDVDFIDIDAEVKYLLAKVNNDKKRFVNDEYFTRLCRVFDLTVRELMATMMERYPEQFGIQFMKEFVKPFVVSLIRERNEYRSGTIGYCYKPIFGFL